MGELKFLGYFDTFNDMINSKDIRDGMTVLVLGHKSKFDGNAKFYHIVTKTTAVKTDIYKYYDCIADKSLKAIPVQFESEDILNRMIDEKIASIDSVVKTIATNISLRS